MHGLDVRNRPISHFGFCLQLSSNKLFLHHCISLSSPGGKRQSANQSKAMMVITDHWLSSILSQRQQKNRAKSKLIPRKKFAFQKFLQMSRWLSTFCKLSALIHCLFNPTFESVTVLFNPSLVRSNLQKVAVGFIWQTWFVCGELFSPSIIMRLNAATWQLQWRFELEWNYSSN